MTISTDYLNIYSDMTKRVLKPLERSLRDCIFLKSIRISADYLFKGHRYSSSINVKTEARHLNSYHEVQNAHYKFMHILTKDKQGMQPSRIIISVTFKSTSSQWKRFKIDLGPQISYDLEFLDREVIEI